MLREGETPVIVHFQRGLIYGTLPLGEIPFVDVGSSVKWVLCLLDKSKVKESERVSL